MLDVYNYESNTDLFIPYPIYPNDDHGMPTPVWYTKPLQVAVSTVYTKLVHCWRQKGLLFLGLLCNGVETA
jgi:hypothetical protein